MYKLLHAKKGRCRREYLYISFIIECRCDNFLSPTSSIYFVWYRYALLCAKLTRNLDAWLLLAGKNLYFMLTRCVVRAFRKPAGARARRIRVRSVSYCRIQPINTRSRARALTHL